MEVFVGLVLEDDSMEIPCCWNCKPMAAMSQ